MDDKHTLGRREFLLGGAVAASTGTLLQAQPATPTGGLPARVLGKTGIKVRVLGLGGQASLEKPGKEQIAEQIIERALDLGVNYFDTAPKYGNGLSQKNLGRVLRARRANIFLAGKTHERASRDQSWRLLEASLKDLNTDHLDLWQLHNVREPEHLDQIFAKNGALRALIEARDQKIVRFLGITGHYDPVVLAQAIERFDFDCVLCSINPADRHPLLFADRWIPHPNRNRLCFQDKLLPVAGKKGLGIIGMKVVARGRVFKPGRLSTMKQALDYALSCPVSAVIVGIDTVQQLEENIRLVSGFKKLTGAQMAHLEAQTASYAHDAAYFKRGGAGGSDN